MYGTELKSQEKTILIHTCPSNPIGGFTESKNGPVPLNNTQFPVPNSAENC